MENSYSVSFRLQRVTTESAHVSVPLTPEFWKQNPERPGTLVIDTDKLAQAAVEEGRSSSTVWTLEAEPTVGLHPWQTPPEH
jgi:hypothetical protein